MLEAFPDVMTDRIGRLLDEKGAMAGNVTSRELRDTVQTAIERALKIDRRMREQHETAIRTANAPKIVKEQSWHTWKDGSMHKLPQKFVLTAKGTAKTAAVQQTVQQAYKRWWLADRSNGICALRLVTFADFFCKNQKKRFHDWKFVCNYLDELSGTKKKKKRGNNFGNSAPGLCQSVEKAPHAS